MVGTYSGKVAYAVMSFGGFLGIGERYHPLPWSKLDDDAGLGGFLMELNRRVLETAPSYGRDETPWANPAYGRGVYGCCVVPYCF